MGVGAEGRALITIHLIVARVTTELTVPRAPRRGNGAGVHVYTAAGTTVVRVFGLEIAGEASAGR